MKYGKVTLNRVEAVWNKLGGEDGVHRFLSGLTEVVPVEHVIDCDAGGEISYYPEWKVDEHRKIGKFIWDASRVRLYMSRQQKLKAGISGTELRKELANKVLLNRCVHGYLLDNPHLIPEEWKGKDIYFWGTVYRYQNDYLPNNNNNGDLFVQYLTWCLGSWCTGTAKLTEVLHFGRAAAVLKK